MEIYIHFYNQKCQIITIDKNDFKYEKKKLNKTNINNITYIIKINKNLF